MPLNPGEQTEVARGILKCFGEDAWWCGRALRFLSLYSVGKVELLSVVQAQAATWQPFLDSGLDIAWWTAEVENQYNATDVVT